MVRARSIASAAVIVLAVVSLPLSILSGWARTQLVDEDAFASTLVPLSQSAPVQDAVIAASTDAITARLDVSALTASVVSGIIDLGVGERAADALRRLEAPAAAAAQQFVEQSVRSAVADAVHANAFRTTWEAVVRQSHRALTTAATSDGAGVVVQTDDGLGIELGAIVAAVAERLRAQGSPIATLIPTVDRVVIVGNGDTLAAIRSGYALGVTLGWWMPVAAAVLFTTGILLARRRLVALRRAALGSAVAAALLLLAAAIGRALVSSAVAGTAVPTAAGLAVYDRLTVAPVTAAGVALAVGLIVAAASGLAGSSASAVGIRRWARRRWAGWSNRRRARNAPASEPSA